MNIRLLYFGSDFQTGLTTALTEQILAMQKLAQINLTVVSSENEMEAGLYQKLQDAAVDKYIVVHLDEHTEISRKALEIARIIDEKQISVVNVHNNWQLALVSWIRLKHLAHRKFKTIYSIHGYRHNSFIKAPIAIGVIGVALWLLADRVISMSSFLSSKFFFLRYKMNIIYYVMSKPEFNKAENTIDCNSLRIVFPAQFRKGKNQHRLIPIIREYIQKTGDDSIQVYLPGDGELLAACKELVGQNGLDKNILFPGKMAHKDVISLYEAANIGLVMTNVETYGRCIAEPFALGRCVITRRTGIADDVIRNGENGFVFDNDRELLTILLKLHDMPTLITTLGNQAFKDKAIFSEENVMKQYLDILNLTR